MTNLDSREAVGEDLRNLLPGGENTYVRLSPGGYGSSAIVRRKFSSPAQLPNI